MVMEKTPIMRRAAPGLIILALLGTSRPLAAGGADPLIRQTAHGKVEGMEAQSSFGGKAVGTWAWLGVPYAAPPVGDLRWKAPRPPADWDGVRPAREFSAICVQYSGLMNSMDCENMGRLIGSEDCLYLNLWRPRTDAKGLPVFFWIYGGGNTVGQSSLNLYDGSNLAGPQDLVVVTFNYRLGPLGWFAHPALRTGDALDDSGNFGTLDILAALNWVHDNIEDFGGDPGNVTIAGESAGGINVFSMLACPPAAGRFHRAIVQSGLPFSNELKSGEAKAGSVLTQLIMKDKLASSSSDAEKYIHDQNNDGIADYLRKKSPQEIMGCYRRVPFGNLLDSNMIFVDGRVIAGKPGRLLARGDYNRVPILAGNNRDEAKLFLPLLLSDLDDAKLCTMIQDMDPDHPQVSLRDYMGPFDQIVYNPLAKIGTAGFKLLGVNVPAGKMSRSQSDIFIYRFDWDEEPEPLDYVIGAGHGLDLAFVFGNFLGSKDSTLRFAWNQSNQAGRIELSERMMAYWANFARTGNPNGDGFPEWKPFPQTMILDTK
ncbi:MAG TPA: carboxylesterase family protein [bacterium]|nr:carboxylesterase family protein [bacterium]